MNEKMAVMVNGKVTMGNGINFMEDTVEESWEWNDGMVCSDGFNGDVSGTNSIVMVCVCVSREWMLSERVAAACIMVLLHNRRTG